VKRVLAGLVLLVVAAAAVYAYMVARRDRTYRELLAQGDAALAQDNTSGAVEAFSGAIALKADAMIGYLKRGETYRRRNDLEAALRDLGRAAELDPSAARAIDALGDVNLSLKRYDAAADRFRAYVALDDRAPRVLYKLAFAQYHAGHPVEAVDALQKAITLDDRFAEAYYLLGLCQRDVQHLDAARVALEQAVAIQPALLPAREELANLYGALSRTDDRLMQLEALSALDPKPSREVALGLTYARAGQPQRAILTLSRAAERYPSYRYAYVALGRVWLENAQAGGDRVALSKALGALEQAMGTEDGSEARVLFGRALLLTSDNESAERMLENAVAKEPVDPLAFYYLAEAAERLGHFQTARQALLDYLALHGEDADARRRLTLDVRLGDLSMKLKEFPTAVGFFRHAAGESAADASVLVHLADAQWRAGEADAARTTLQRALDRAPADPDALALKRRFAAAPVS
jgi:tetratricopeptide (TPR) repeat protein